MKVLVKSLLGAMRWFIGGQQALMPEVLAMVACTVNSYSRLVPGYWAPTSATWGVENRTTALRVIRGGAVKPARRVPDRRGRHQSLHRAGRGHRLRTLGHRASHRTGCRRSSAMPMTREHPPAAAAARHTVRSGRAAGRLASRRARCLAMRSSSIMRQRANGKSASFARRSLTGNWRRYFEII